MAPVRRGAILDALSERAPVIAVVTQCAALVIYWVNAPFWLPYGLAIVVSSLAVVLMAARGRRAQFTSNEDQDLNGNEGWIAQELAGKGTPQGFYLLGFFGFVTIMLTGFQGAYATPAWAAFALGAAWGIANARYTTGDRSES